MQVQVIHAPVHTPEQVREIMREAVAVAGELVGDGDEWNVAFEQACILLGARCSFPVPQQQVALDPRLLAAGGRH